MKIVLSDVSDACLLVTEICMAVWRDSRSTSLRSLMSLLLQCDLSMSTFLYLQHEPYSTSISPCLFLSKCQLFITSVIIQCKLSFSLLNLVEGYLLILVWLVNKVISSFHLYVWCMLCRFCRYFHQSS